MIVREELLSEILCFQLLQWSGEMVRIAAWVMGFC